MTDAGPTAAAKEADRLALCRSCGACCAYSRDWPRFTLETEDEIGRIPAHYMDERQAGMRCIGNRCAALGGEVGVSTACAIYEQRPHVCRACEPEDEACSMARAHFGLQPCRI